MNPYAMMKACLIAICTYFSFCCCLKGQERVYHIDLKKDALLLGGGIALWGSSNYLKSVSEKASLSDISDLQSNSVWGFDRGATGNFSSGADRVSDVLLYGAASIPFAAYATKAWRGEGGAVAIMALETFFSVNGLTNIVKSTVNRYRPFNYNPEVSDDLKLSSGSRYSFLSGHTSGAAAFSFFTATVMTDLFPDSKWKPVIWASAAAVPAVTGFLRYEAGKHFPSDILAGYALGAAIGTLIPRLHRNKNSRFNVGFGNGISFQMTF